MALFTDSNHVTPLDLAKIDASLLETAAAIGIDPLDHITAAWSDVGMEIRKYTTSIRNGSLYGVSALHGWNNGYRCQLPQVVVSSAESPEIIKAIAYRALELFYESALNTRNDSDVYRAKLERYQERAEDRFRELRNMQIKLVPQPLAAPASVNVDASGSFALSLIASGGSATADATYDVALTYSNSFTVINGESGPSPRQTITVTAAGRISVDTSKLRWPDGYFGGAAKYGLAANSWGVYCGAPGCGLYLVQAYLVGNTYVFDPAVAPAMIPLGTGQKYSMLETMRSL